MLFLVSVTISRLKSVMYLFLLLTIYWNYGIKHIHKRAEILLTLLQLLFPVSGFSLDEGKGWIIYLEQRTCSQIIDVNFCLCSWSEQCLFPFAAVTYRMEAMNRCAQLVSEGWLFSPGGSRVTEYSRLFPGMQGGRNKEAAWSANTMKIHRVLKSWKGWGWREP